ncbi:MAG TPA: hypothetical protein VKV02_06460 [Acidobacteriaceae bacterium]|nr:hypothetical protein [Acidobacteriaceae bacterium]
MTPQETELVLDRTLRALGHANPSTGFTGRLQARLAQPAAAPPTRPNRVFFRPLHQVFAFSVVALLCTVAILRSHTRPAIHVTVLHSRLGAGPNSPTRVEPTLAAKHSPARRVRTPEPGNLSLGGGIGPTGLSNSPTIAPRLPLPSLDAAKVPDAILVPPPEPTSAIDAQAVADLHAPSLPAPPRPLTSQERLVALMLRQGEKHDLAELDPSQTSAFLATEQAAFQQFFEPAKTLTPQENASEPPPPSTSPQP